MPETFKVVNRKVNNRLDKVVKLLGELSDLGDIVGRTEEINSRLLEVLYSPEQVRVILCALAPVHDEIAVEADEVVDEITVFDEPALDDSLSSFNITPDEVVNGV